MKTTKNSLFAMVIFSLLFACENPEDIDNIPFIKGADLSYLNEMMNCGAVYRQDGEEINPYTLFAKEGCDLVRVRLWHNPQWTKYSNFPDARKTIHEAKSHGMKVLLDFHYSDTWADPQKQYIPEAWAGITDVEILGDSVYEYTKDILIHLARDGVLPEIVQVGNETNIEIMQDSADLQTETIHWDRNIYLLNRGLQAVKDVAESHDQKIERMLHIAQPEHALPWFREAFENGIADFEWIGLSYYPKWSRYSMDSLSTAIDILRKSYEKKVMVVETAYPHGIYNADEANNLLWKDSVIDSFPATPEGQLAYLNALTRKVKDGGGRGIVYWEPAWVSTGCSTPWGKGSHWENATFFDSKNKNETLPAFDFFHSAKN